MKILASQFSMSILYFFLLGFLVAGPSYAASPLLKTYHQVLKDYQLDHDPVKAFSRLQLAGIQAAIDKQPADVTTSDYVRLLNDYAYFRYESVAFKKNVPITVKHGQQSYAVGTVEFVGNERMLHLADIPNPVMKMQRLCEAIHILHKVIALDPERSVAYLNLGDAYWRFAEYSLKLGSFGGRQGWEGRKVSKQVPCLQEQKQIYDGYFRGYEIYQQYRDKMVAQGRGEEIPERIKTLLEHQYYYTVVLDLNIQIGDHLLCEDYQGELNRLSYEDMFASGTRGVIEHSEKFKLLDFDSFTAEQKLGIRKMLRLYDGYSDPRRIYEYNGTVYGDDGSMFLVQIHLVDELLSRYGAGSERCHFDGFDFKRNLKLFY